MGLLDTIDNLLGTRLGLLVNDPRAAISQMNQQAGAFNQASLLAVQAERNAINGIPSTPEQLAAKQMVDDYTRDLAMGFAGNIKTVGKTPYELAQEVAQRNAVKMLGLPANNTAMDRAKVLGYDTPAFHATTKDITFFDKSKRGSATDYGWYGPGEYSAPRPQSAEAYVMSDFPNYKLGANIIPLLAKNPEKITNKHGFITEYVTRNPSQLRSKFAAFDPARVNEPDLLAAGIPFGLLAGTNIEMPKNKEKRK